MKQAYNIADHGDLLEREAADFIRNKFPYYEVVWQTYIGNTGNATKAILPNYPWESKRSSFAEHSYTTLESCFMIQYILNSNIFISEIDSFDKYIDLNKSFVTFFAYLGRIRDTAIKASNDLNYDNTSFKNSMKEFYEARNIVIHGKKIPILLDPQGFIMMPILKTEYTKGKAWNDKGNGWSDVSEMETTLISDSCENYFDALLQIINKEYAQFNDIIQQELKAIPTALEFNRDNINLLDQSPFALLPPSSGSTFIIPSGNGVDIYRIKEYLKAKEIYRTGKDFNKTGQ